MGEQVVKRKKNAIGMMYGDMSIVGKSKEELDRKRNKDKHKKRSDKEL